MALRSIRKTTDALAPLLLRGCREKSPGARVMNGSEVA